MDSEDVDLLRGLEESLWRAETRFDRGYMERVLHPQFSEFGRSGRSYTREQTLALTGEQIRAELPLRQFAAAEIGPDVVLLTYVSVVHDQERQVSNRSSLWVRSGGGWLLRFHQCTPTGPA